MNLSLDMPIVFLCHLKNAKQRKNKNKTNSRKWGDSTYIYQN